MAVLVEHDTEAGVIYIRLAEGDVARTVEIDEMLMVDEDATGNPIGIEFLTALPPPHLWERLYAHYPHVKEHFVDAPMSGPSGARGWPGRRGTPPPPARRRGRQRWWRRSG